MFPGISNFLEEIYYRGPAPVGSRDSLGRTALVIKKIDKHLNAEFQRIARRDKKAFLIDQCKEIEGNNRLVSNRKRSTSRLYIVTLLI